MIRLTLPIPPSVNHYWKRGRNGRLFIGEEGQAFKDAVGVACQAQALTPFAGRVVVNAWVYRPADRGDLDNYLKALLDAIKGYVYQDDKQVYELHIYKHLDRQKPRVELTVEEVPELQKPKRRALF